jgi:hypothetical protein
MKAVSASLRDVDTGNWPRRLMLGLLARGGAASLRFCWLDNAFAP